MTAQVCMFGRFAVLVKDNKVLNTAAPSVLLWCWYAILTLNVGTTILWKQWRPWSLGAAWPGSTLFSHSVANYWQKDSKNQLVQIWGKLLYFVKVSQHLMLLRYGHQTRKVFRFFCSIKRINKMRNDTAVPYRCRTGHILRKSFLRHMHCVL